MKNFILFFILAVLSFGTLISFGAEKKTIARTYNTKSLIARSIKLRQAENTCLPCSKDPETCCISNIQFCCNDELGGCCQTGTTCVNLGGQGKCN